MAFSKLTLKKAITPKKAMEVMGQTTMFITTKKETFISNRIGGFILMWMDDITSYKNLKDLVDNIIEECHDGAYSMHETKEPFDDIDMQEYCLKFFNYTY